MKAVEICKVKSLKYATLPSSGHSCCKMILKVIDPNSEVYSKTFKLTLPDLVTFPDFLVKRSRYEGAIRGNGLAGTSVRFGGETKAKKMVVGGKEEF